MVRRGCDPQSTEPTATDTIELDLPVRSEYNIPEHCVLPVVGLRNAVMYCNQTIRESDARKEINDEQ